jgi:pimeloyl-ACP methyl ester carboxylesterase
MTVITSYQAAATKSVDVNGTTFAYREPGPATGTPVIFLNHLAAVLDNWDPRVVDGIAAKHRVITFDNRGVGASSGKTPNSVEVMARDAVAFIKALGLAQVDLLGFSMGGFVAQVIAQQEPQLVRKVILAGTGPAGGRGIENVTALTYLDMLRGALTVRDAKHYLFFTRTPNGKAAARDFMKRLKERTNDRDKPISIRSFRAHLKAIHAWGLQESADLSRIQQPVFLANGDQDRMVPSSNSADLARRLPNAQLAIYPDAGHGGIFQHHQQFVPAALEFLAPEQNGASASSSGRVEHAEAS